jgi:glycine/D-amino acid oxidase-like deaminating enzyme
MRVAILGGGFQGCCAAIELAMRGCRVSLYERNSILLAGAATANEGKIHLGYTYASDRSLNTARTLLAGALSFAPLLNRYLDAEVPLKTSHPFTYVVHRDTQVKTEDFAAYLEAVHNLAAAAAGPDRYFGIDLCDAPQRLTRAELESRFNPRYAAAAFYTPEIAIDTVAVAKLMRRRIAEDPRIQVRINRTVAAVEDDDVGLRVRSFGADSNDLDSEIFDTVVNALWEGRLAVDATRGLRPDRKWIHRLKYGIRFRLIDGQSLPSITVVLGPFGDLVAYGDGAYYISWYPACMAAHCGSLTPPACWATKPDDMHLSKIAKESFCGMETIVPQLKNVSPQDIVVRAGIIVAWGSTDIDDRASELHCRHEIGVHSYNHYHSIDPGKFTMAPRFARVCADRIALKTVS